MLRSYPRRPQRLDGFYDREPAARCAANFMSGFMPDGVGSFNKKIRPSITFLSTELSTGIRADDATENTAHRNFQAEIGRKNAATAPLVEKNII